MTDNNKVKKHLVLTSIALCILIADAVLNFILGFVQDKVIFKSHASIYNLFQSSYVYIGVRILLLSFIVEIVLLRYINKVNVVLFTLCRTVWVIILIYFMEFQFVGLNFSKSFLFAPLDFHGGLRFEYIYLLSVFLISIMSYYFLRRFKLISHLVVSN